MKLGTYLNLTNSLSMTPELQQAVKLLQLSALDLNAEIQKILAPLPSKPMFLYAALQDMHAPNQVQLLVANHRII